LAQVLRHLPPSISNPQVLVGLDTPDDAGVFRLTDDLALVQTVDFFTPIVDDPYSFGQIAAANALSDVYAMGGRPITALNIVSFPIGKLPHEVLAEILRGGADKVREAGAILLGGHSIDEAEPKFGMAVTGTIEPRAVRTKAGARPGDVLVLTKAIGIGVITTAIKKGIVASEDEQQATQIMAALNDVGAVLKDPDIHALTDVTGFGLLGHAHEMARASQVGMRIRSGRVPVLPCAWRYAELGVWPGGMAKNRSWLSDKIEFSADVSEPMRSMLCDPVTSGGLLFAVDARAVDRLVHDLQQQGRAVAVIGECADDDSGRLTVTG
jgi:selenide, water dikinase